MPHLWVQRGKISWRKWYYGKISNICKRFKIFSTIDWFVVTYTLKHIFATHQNYHLK